MRRCEFTKLVNCAIPVWSGLATTFLASVLSIASPATSNSGEAKKPIHIGVVCTENLIRVDEVRESPNLR
jgi:hypothetical protein